MRDIFEDIFKNDPLDPMESARRHGRQTLRKRFYTTAGVTRNGDLFEVTLDGKPVRTPSRRSLATPSQDLSQAIADEWQAQTDMIDPANMPLTRLANSIIDGVADRPELVRDEMVKYLGSDLLFYRADGPEGLIERQSAAWDPLVMWAANELGAHFIMVEGVVFAAQPPEAVAAASKAIPTGIDADRLGIDRACAHARCDLAG
jgi:chaperone required for assembly of F1-ATPase